MTAQQLHKHRDLFFGSFLSHQQNDVVLTLSDGSADKARKMFLFGNLLLFCHLFISLPPSITLSSPPDFSFIGFKLENPEQNAFAAE